MLTALGSSAVLFNATGTVGAASSEDDIRSSDKSRVSEGHTLKLSESNALSKSEFKRYEDRMEQKYGSEAAAQITPEKQTVDSETGGVSIMAGSSPNNTSNMSYVSAWNDEYKVKGGVPEWTVAHTDHALTLYRSTETDADGRYLYFFWHWSQAESNDDYWHPEGKIKLIESGLNSDTLAQVLTDFSPSSVSSVNGAWVKAGVTAGIAGNSVGIEGEICVEDGTFGPKTGSIDTGEAGQHYTVLDLNDLTGAHTLNATTVIRSPFYFDTEFLPGLTWRTRVVGNP